jgi:hypothetical protein
MEMKTAYETPGMFRVGGFQEVTSGCNFLLLDSPLNCYQYPYLVANPLGPACNNHQHC